MKLTVLSFLLSFMSACLFAQTIQNDVIGTTGGSAESGTISIEYSVGETVIETAESTEITLTQGFLQPMLSVTSIDDENILSGISVYPNPVGDELIIEISGDFIHPLQSMLFDINGKLLYESQLSSGTHTLNMQKYVQGTYFLKIVDVSAGKSMNSEIIKVR